MTFGILGNLANKGPCDSGFHIPTSSEISSLFTRLTHLGIVNNVNTYTDYLLIPPAYYLNRSTGTLNTQYGIVRLWSCDMSSNTNATAFYINENNVIYYGNDKPANGFPIRAFKDIPVTPDGSWTVMYQGTGDDGIFRNSTKGLISIVDGSNILTIQDHNVGATTVWQPGDTVDDSNAGLFYQFGNNYGFPYSGATEFYTTTQNTSGYGPENPYWDSHFVKVSSNNWFTPNNSSTWNIRGKNQAGTKILTEPKSISYKLETGAEVWYNSQLGLYSFTKDHGNTWTTIADKDLGANIVGQEGNLFQWGNDYGFPATGTVSRSTAVVNVDNYGPGNHYNTSTWSRSNTIYSTTYSTSPYTYGKDLRGGTTGTPSARQGPCPSGSHVPSQVEINALLNCIGGLGHSLLPDDACALIKLPFAGSLVYEDATTSNQGITVRYWTSDGYQSGRAYALTGNVVGGTFSTANPIAVTSSTNIASGFSIRPFYNTGVDPRAELSRGQVAVSGNYELWYSLMEKSFTFTTNGGTTWTSFWDRNLGATEVWNYGDRVTSANCGYYFQRGNNYGFPFDGQNISTTTALVSAGGYGPGNYYSSSNFVTTTANPATWLANPMLNLRGGLGATADRRGPCPEGFHVPTRSEFSSISSLYSYLGFITSGHYRYTTSGSATSTSGQSLRRYTCEHYSNSNAYSCNRNGTTYNNYMYYQYYIRPFKNVPIVPSVETGWTRTYQGTATRDINQIYAQGNKVRPPDSTKIILSKDAVTVPVGSYVQIDKILLPEATKDTVTYTSSDDTIADAYNGSLGRVSIDGNSAGTCVITATTTSGATATCTVTVTA